MAAELIVGWGGEDNGNLGRGIEPELGGDPAVLNADMGPEEALVRHCLEIRVDELLSGAGRRGRTFEMVTVGRRVGRDYEHRSRADCSSTSGGDDLARVAPRSRRSG